jgi:hypothetical protein
LAEWFGTPEVLERVSTEEHARDSFENFLFSLCRFHEIAGRYPEKVTIISFASKESRFRNLHRQALHYPDASLVYIGINPPSPSIERLSEIESKYSFGPFATDMYGCHGVLKTKRVGRNPFRASMGYGLAHGSCPEMHDLLKWCGPGLFPGPVPWGV